MSQESAAPVPNEPTPSSPPVAPAEPIAAVVTDSTLLMTVLTDFCSVRAISWPA